MYGLHYRYLFHLGLTDLEPASTTDDDARQSSRGGHDEERVPDRAAGTDGTADGAQDGSVTGTGDPFVFLLRSLWF